MLCAIYFSFIESFIFVPITYLHMIIRNASLNDVDSCFIISSQENENYWTKEDFVNCIKNTNAIILIAEENDKIVGYITGYIVPTKNDEAMVHESRIDTNHRGKKIGTKLVQEFCNEAFGKNVKIVYALIESKLKPFYINSCNFKKTGNWIETSIRLNDEK